MGCHPSSTSAPKSESVDFKLYKDLLNSNKIRAASISEDFAAFLFGRFAKGCFSPSGKHMAFRFFDFDFLATEGGRPLRSKTTLSPLG